MNYPPNCFPHMPQPPVNIAVIYMLYIAVSLAMTVWVARTLHRNGGLFLIDAFRGNAPLAEAVNHLLVVGFYLVNIGYILLALKTTDPLMTPRDIIETESWKIGVVVMILGLMHMANIVVLALLRLGGRRDHGPEKQLAPA
ncbi:MAG TPA: hypothetical protein VGM11_15750 [Acidobacteriaceae bacterium]